MSLDDPVEPEPVGGTNGAAAKFVPAGARGRRGARLPVLKGVADSKDLAMKGVDALGVGGAEAGAARRPGGRGRGGARRNQVASLPPCHSTPKPFECGTAPNPFPGCTTLVQKTKGIHLLPLNPFHTIVVVIGCSVLLHDPSPDSEVSRYNPEMAGLYQFGQHSVSASNPKP